MNILAYISHINQGGVIRCIVVSVILSKCCQYTIPVQFYEEDATNVGVCIAVRYTFVIY